MRVFFVQGQPGCSEQAQRKAILEHTGLAEGSPDTVFYRVGRGAEDFTAAAKRARGGAVETAWGLRPLGSSRGAIAMALKAAREEVKAGFHVLDVVTGLRSDRDGVEMLDTALSRIHGESSMGNRARELGALGGKSRATKIRLTRIPRDDAERIWLTAATDRQAAEMCGRGWSKSTLTREFGKSPRKPGRRPKDVPPAFITPKSKTPKKKRRKVVSKRKRK